MKAYEWIDRAKAMRGWPSDYRAAEELGLTRQAISKCRAKPDATLDEKTALRLAIAIGERPEGIIVDQAAERATDPVIRATLADAARRLCVLC